MHEKCEKLIAVALAIGIFWGLPGMLLAEPKNDKALLPPTVLKVIATAYSSHEDQTDDTPQITASNKKVYDGVLAANFLKFGTKIRIPELFGDKIFTVEDRMNRRFNRVRPPRVDIWFSTLTEAKNFGVRKVEIEILNN